MNINELIEKLEKYKEIHGNREVCFIRNKENFKERVYDIEIEMDAHRLELNIILSEEEECKLNYNDKKVLKLLHNFTFELSSNCPIEAMGVGSECTKKGTAEDCLHCWRKALEEKRNQ